MLLRKSQKKLYYTSGLISLLLLPVLCVLFLQKNNVFEPFYAIELNAWTHEQSSIWRKSGYDYDIHPKRNFIDISLKGNDTEDKIKLDFVQLQMRDLIKSNDTVSGIHIVFGNQSKYWELIETLNICIKEKAKTYVLVGNDFWFFNFYPKPIKKNDNYVTYKIETAGFCSTSEHQCVPKKIKESNLTFNGSLNTFYFSLSVLFLLMCWLAFKQLKSIWV